jgi:hypothetical protein
MRCLNCNAFYRERPGKRFHSAACRSAFNQRVRRLARRATADPETWVELQLEMHWMTQEERNLLYLASARSTGRVFGSEMAFYTLQDILLGHPGDREKPKLEGEPMSGEEWAARFEAARTLYEQETSEIYRRAYRRAEAAGHVIPEEEWTARRKAEGVL